MDTSNILRMETIFLSTRGHQSGTNIQPRRRIERKKGEAYEASHEEGTASILSESVRFEGYRSYCRLAIVQGRSGRDGGRRVIFWGPISHSGNSPPTERENLVRGNS